MSNLLVPLIVGATAVAAITAYFVFEAFRTSDWSRLKGMLAEFVAVFSAIAIGIWISGIERTIDREEARLERQAERNEIADALVQASIFVMASVIENLANNELAVSDDLLDRPNVIDSLVASPEAVRRFGNEFDDIAQQYRTFLRLNRAAVDECGIPSNMYVAVVSDRVAEQAVDRWVWHLDEYDIRSSTAPFEYLREFDTAEESRRVEALTGVHFCVSNRTVSQLRQSYELYEALCVAAAAKSIENTCDWGIVTNDPAERQEYLDSIPSDPFERGLRRGRFSEAVERSQVVAKHNDLIDAITARRERLSSEAQ